MPSARPVIRMQKVGHLDAIPPGEGRAFRVGTEEVAVFRARNGCLYAVQARCTHAGGPLVDGLIGDGRVLCPLHGFAFELDSGEPILNSCPALRTYPVACTVQREILIGMSDDREAEPVVDSECSNHDSPV